MEKPLNARDFLSRFHLPQLIRIKLADEARVNKWAQVDRSPSDTRTKHSAPWRRATSSRDQKEQRCNWTYLEPEFVRAERGVGVSRPADEPDEPTNDAEARLRSMSTWSMSLESTSKTGDDNRVSHQLRAQSAADIDECAATKRSSDCCGSAAAAASSESAGRDAKELGASIRLHPPTSRPTLSKLELEQPFLLYKAYKKVELCAYVIDRRNELIDKSGHPIYFPFNYPGWFAITEPTNRAQTNPICGQPSGHTALDSILQVCESESQIFLTRDQLIGYRIPAKLSHLTKLKDNKLLALPLAVNLDRGQKLSHSSSAGPNSAGVNNISQLVIEGGKVLMISAIYEDVLPLIERTGHKHAQPPMELFAGVSAARAHPVHWQAQPSFDMNPLADAIYQNGRFNAVKLPAETAAAQKQTKSKEVKRRANASKASKAKRQSAPSDIDYQADLGASQGYALSPPLIYANQAQPHTLVNVDQPKWINNSRPIGQRYARCIVLSEQSINRLTGLPNRLDEDHYKSPSRDQCSDSAQNPQEELEVLIPINQKGRFYLCATNQSILNDLYSYNQVNTSHYHASHHNNKIYRLSQIIYQLNMFERLSSTQAHHRGQQSGSDCSQQHRASLAATSKLATSAQCRSLKLPLSVQLICGPRPANFSPTMFGASSTMESYLDIEENVASHKISCRFNKSQLSLEQAIPRLDSECNCGRDLVRAQGSSEAYGTFSARLRFESLTKRDVLLACTIKRDPLVHLDLFKCQPSSVGSRQAHVCDSDESSEADSKRTSQSYAHLKFSHRHADQRLLALRESVESTSNLNVYCQKQANSKRDHSKSLGKSSFSRLQACRSLISLNGRRKQRPKIPSSMLLGTGNQQSAHERLNSSQVLKDSSGPEQSQCDIVMIELDCGDPELKFSRTFIEQSIPTANIPDLVLNRVNYCHQNSHQWEAQLKLTYQSLAQDFDSCRGQIESNGRLATSRHLVAANETGAASRFGSGLRSQLEAATKEGASSDAKRNSQRARSPSCRSENSIDSSTESSRRSSSGVSSSGEKRCKRTSAASSQPDSHESSPKSTSRLLRLVQRVLPNQFVGSNGAGGGPSAKHEPPTDLGTLMNAQKIHRRLAAAKSDANKQPPATPVGADEPTRARQERDSSDAHLYESLDVICKQIQAQARPHQSSLNNSSTESGAKPAKSSEPPCSSGRDNERSLADRRPNRKKKFVDLWSADSSQVSNGSSRSFGADCMRGSGQQASLRHSANGCQPEALEPVSFEVCYEQFVSKVEDDEGSGELRRDSSEVSSDCSQPVEQLRWKHRLRHRRTMSLGLDELQRAMAESRLDDASEQLYVNLSKQPASSLDPVANDEREPDDDRSRKFRGRMERKAMRIRAQRTQKCQAANRAREQSLEALSLADSLESGGQVSSKGSRQLASGHKGCRSQHRADLFKLPLGSTSVAAGESSSSSSSIGSSVDVSLRLGCVDRSLVGPKSALAEADDQHRCHSRYRAFKVKRASEAAINISSASDFSSIQSSLDSRDSLKTGSELSVTRRSMSYSGTSQTSGGHVQRRLYQSRLTTLDRARR